MHMPSIPGRGLAIVAGTALYIGSLSALFGDDLLDPSKWTMHHYEVIVTSLSTIAFGLLCRYAKRARKKLAAFGFAFLFVVGTGFVVYKSIGRQATATTTQAMSAEDSNALIADKMADLATTRQRLNDAEKEIDHERKGRPDRAGKATVKPGCGDRCKDWERRATEVRSRIQQLEGELRVLGPRQVAAPEAATFAAILNIIFGWSAATVKAMAILFVPIAWTMFLEIGSISCFEYAFSHGKPEKTAQWKTATTSVPSFSDTAQTSFSTTHAGDVRALVAPLPENDVDGDGPNGPQPPKGRKTRKTTSTMPERKTTKPESNVVPLFGHPVVGALEKIGRHVSNGELADLMGCSDSEATKRWKEVADLLDLGWNGRFRSIGLKAWSAKATA